MSDLNFKLPNINGTGLSDKKYAKKISNYLMMLEESLRYSLGNIDEDNVTEKFIQDLTVGHLLITNGENSIIGNPEDGFQMYRGIKKIIDFNLNTGKALYCGDIEITNGTNSILLNPDIGLEMISDGYSMLSFNINTGRSIFRGDMEGGSITGSSFRSNFDPADPNEAYMYLDGGLLNFYADGGSLFLKIAHSGIEGFGQYAEGARNLMIRPATSEIEVGSIYSDYINSVTMYENGTSLSNKYAPILHSHGGYASQSELDALESRVSALEV